MRSELHLFETNPIIAAVKDERQLERTFALENDILFLLFGNICTIGTLVRRAKEAGKLAFVHLDLTQGLSSKDVAADFVKEYARADGVISTRPALLCRAKTLGLITVLRVFLVDSLSLDNLNKQIAACDPDLIEIMPGVMPKVIRQVCQTVRRPVITGGMISDKEDVIAALSAGALCVSTSCEELTKDE